MFETQRLLGTTKRSITLHTHLGTPIENEIALEPDERSIRKFDYLFDKHRLGWLERKPPSGVYNCVGHVWACRRTAVYENLESQVLRILEDDGYRTVDWSREPLAPGDLVTYWGSARNHTGFMHVGMVYELRQVAGSAQSIPWVLSKWDDASGEVLHHYRDCPFTEMFEAQFWTDRPLGRNVK